MKLPWLPLRWVIPLLLLCSAVMSGFGFYFYESYENIRVFEQRVKQEVFREISLAASFSEHMLLRKNADLIAQEMEDLATDRSLDALVLITPEAKVMYATRLAWLGEQSSVIDADLKQLITTGQKIHRRDVHFSDDRTKLYTRFPIRFPGNDIRSHNFGLLLSRHDLSSGKQQMMHDLEFRLAFFVGLFALMALMVWLISYFGLTKRVQRVVDTTDAFSKGHLDVRTNISGHDEISHISSAFDHMADLIQLSAQETVKLAGVVEHMVECVFITDVNGVIEYVNPAFTRITGYDAEEAIGETPRLLNSGEHSKKYFEALWKRITSGTVWRSKIIDKRKDGTLYTAWISIVPVKDGQENITHFVSVQEDITDQIEKDKKLQHSMRMESLGTLVGGIAHEFNNMLAGIVGNIYLARKRAENDEKTTALLNRVEQISHRAGKMIKQLLAFARQDNTELSPLNLTSVISEDMSLIRVTVPENIVLEEHICAEKMVVQGDKVQIQQVLMNLLANAGDALSGSSDPRIEISLRPFKADKNFREKHPECRSHYALLSVCDNGHGIAEADVSRIFEPFFTTKHVGEGTGLGLSMVFGSIEYHNGILEVDSSPGEGACFNIYYPIAQGSCLGDKPDMREEILYGNGERILLADDEQVVQEAIQNVLEHAGYHVTVVNDGLEAVDCFNSDPDAFDLVILDVVMPKMGGVDTIKKIREIRPDIGVIFLTAYEKEKYKGIELITESVVFYKPVKPEKLCATVANMLGSGKPPRI